EIAHPHAPLGGDELHVNGAHLAVVEHEVARLVAADYLGLRADVEGAFVRLTAEDLERATTDLQATLRDDRSIHGFALYHAQVAIRQAECAAHARMVSWVGSASRMSPASGAPA